MACLSGSCSRNGVTGHESLGQLWMCGSCVTGSASQTMRAAWGGEPANSVGADRWFAHSKH